MSDFISYTSARAYSHLHIILKRHFINIIVNPFWQNNASERARATFWIQDAALCPLFVSRTVNLNFFIKWNIYEKNVPIINIWYVRRAWPHVFILYDKRSRAWIYEYYMITKYIWLHKKKKPSLICFVR